jgi:hypothetical protein
MASRTNAGVIATQTARVLDYRGAPLRNRIAEFAAPIIAVDTSTDCIAGVEVSEGGRPHCVPRELEGQRRASHSGHEVPDGKAQLGV